MSKESKELEDEILSEFEWDFQDPNAEKIKQLGEVVSIIATKLTEAISELQQTVASLQAEVNGLDNKISSLGSRISGGATVSPADGASLAAGMADGEPIAAATPKPAAPPSAGGGMSMMGELKQLLAARRRKAETGD